MAKNKKEARKSRFCGIEQLFGSRTRFLMLRLFCASSDQKFFVRELARQMNGQLNAVRREIDNLVRIGVIVEAENQDAKKKFYRLNTKFVLSAELGALIGGSELLAKKQLVDMLQEIANIDLCILTGGLVGAKTPCDILIVGHIKKDALAKIVQMAELEIGKPISYTVFSPEEYRQRKMLTDKFLYAILDEKKMVAIDKGGEFEEERKGY